MHRSRLPIPLLLAVVVFACATPPSKEMNQAQGAIDAARAAGADVYAPAELNAAIDVLRRSEQAVAQRDYRLALSLAIDSRERAQTAAKVAVNVRAKARGDIEGQIGQASALLAQARARLREPDVARLPRRTVQDQRAVIDAANKSLQDARAALDIDDYAKASQAMDGVVGRIQKAIAVLDTTGDGGTGRRRR
jgi:Domain of unknown function (DUF4398)